jgi:hypothetical protein
MMKRMILALVPLALLATTVRADDDLFNMNAASISDASIEIEEASLDDLDVDQLAADADGEGSEDAIEACFRRFGYGYGRGFGYGYGYGYGHCYRPVYRYHYPSYYCYRPVYRCVYPVTVYRHYWGCY